MAFFTKRYFSRMSYGVSHVIGGMAPHVTKDSYVAYAIERTTIERWQLENLIQRFAPKAQTSIEFGCGFGRMLRALPAHVGIERDDELRRLAIAFGYEVYSWANIPANLSAQLGVTFTFLQHLGEREMQDAFVQIRSRITETLILCEETEGDFHDCHGRTPERYAELLPAFTLIHTEERMIEPGNRSTAQYMIFQHK